MIFQIIRLLELRTPDSIFVDSDVDTETELVNLLAYCSISDTRIPSHCDQPTL